MSHTYTHSTHKKEKRGFSPAPGWLCTVHSPCLHFLEPIPPTPEWAIAQPHPELSPMTELAQLCLLSHTPGISQCSLLCSSLLVLPMSQKQDVCFMGENQNSQSALRQRKWGEVIQEENFTFRGSFRIYNLTEVWTNQEDTFVKSPTIHTYVCVSLYINYTSKKLTNFHACWCYRGTVQQCQCRRYLTPPPLTFSFNGWLEWLCKDHLRDGWNGGCLEQVSRTKCKQWA